MSRLPSLNSASAVALSPADCASTDGAASIKAANRK
jgi:hypothetical protein